MVHFARARPPTNGHARSRGRCSLCMPNPATRGVEAEQHVRLTHMLAVCVTFGVWCSLSLSKDDNDRGRVVCIPVWAALCQHDRVGNKLPSSVRRTTTCR